MKTTETTQPTPRSSSPSPAAILPWHKAAAAACFEKTSHPFAKDIAESIARHDPAPEMAEALQMLVLVLADLAKHPAFEDDAPEFNDGGDAREAMKQARALLARINGNT